MSGLTCVTCGASIRDGESYRAKGPLSAPRDPEHATCRAGREASDATAAAIVAWLRSYRDDGLAQSYADAIERGEWRK